MRARVLAALAVAPVLLAAGIALGASAGDEEGSDRPDVGRIAAFAIEGHATRYRIHAFDAEGRSIDYTWSFEPPPDEPECLDFRQEGEVAIWRHGADAGCQHELPAHAGVVRVAVRIGPWTCTAVYHGSGAGVADAGEPATCVRETATTEVASTDPPYVAPPTCATSTSLGLFEPTQGVWQDDPTFADRPGKRIVRVADTRLRAELPLVARRWTVLVGVERLANSSWRTTRQQLLFRASTYGSTPVPVKLRLTRVDASGETVLDTRPLAEWLPLGGPCEATTEPIELRLDFPYGYPSEPFVLPRAGPYVLRLDIVDASDRPTGISAEVEGTVVETRLPGLAFVPVLVDSDLSLAALARETARLAAAAGETMPQLFPVADEPLRARVFSLGLDFRVLMNRESPLDPLRRALGRWWYLNTSAQQLATAEIQRLIDGGALLGGLDRVVAVTSHGGFARMAAQRAGGFASSTKVVWVRQGGRGSVVAHEIAHTLPFPWAEAGMRRECRLNYHNTGASIAHGMRIAGTSAELAPTRRPGTWTSFMSAFAGNWVDQCTYAHLLKQLQGAVDPPVTLVQGIVGRHRGRVAGRFRPGQELMGYVDLERGGGGDWALRVRAAGGAVVGRYPFEPRWGAGEGGRAQPFAAFSYRLPRVPAGASVELVGPRGVLDRLRVSRHAPRVRIVRVRGRTVEWRATDADGDPVVATVLYSADGGETWLPQVYDTRRRSFAARLEPYGRHRVRVVVTDGVRSAQAETRLVSSG